MKNFRLASACFGLVSLVASTAAAADTNLAFDATITGLTANNDNSVTYMTLFVTGGTGTCSTIKLRTSGTTAEEREIMTKLATAAYLSGKKVRVVAYDTTSCNAGDYVAVSN